MEISKAKTPNDLPQASALADSDFLMAIGANGDGKKLGKKALAAAMSLAAHESGQVLPIIERKSSNGDLDLNSIQKTSLVRLAQDYQSMGNVAFKNMPWESCPLGGFAVLTIRYGASDAYATQIAFGYSQVKLYMRHRSYSAGGPLWSPWSLLPSRAAFDALESRVAALESKVGGGKRLIINRISNYAERRAAA